MSYSLASLVSLVGDGAKVQSFREYMPRLDEPEPVATEADTPKLLSKPDPQPSHAKRVNKSLDHGGNTYVNPGYSAVVQRVQGLERDAFALPLTIAGLDGRDPLVVEVMALVSTIDVVRFTAFVQQGPAQFAGRQVTLEARGEHLTVIM